jgi:hypothetical protein
MASYNNRQQDPLAWHCRLASQAKISSCICVVVSDSMITACFVSQQRLPEVDPFSVPLLYHCRCPPDVGLQAVRVLANVSMGPPQYRSALADGGAIPLLVKSLSSSSSSSGNSSLMEVQYTCVTTLDSLAVYSSANKKLITEAGGVQAVVSLLRHVSRSNGSADGEGGGGGAGRNQSLAAALQEACAGLLESLATRYPSNCLAIEAAGGIRLLQQLVRAAIAGASSGGLDAGLAAGVKEASISALKRLGAIVPQC